MPSNPATSCWSRIGAFHPRGIHFGTEGESEQATEWGTVYLSSFHQNLTGASIETVADT
jgi:hypothetical protein